MKASELKRWRESQGCTFEEGTSHWIVRFGDTMTTVPRHASKEVKTGTYHSILRKQGLKKPR